MFTVTGASDESLLQLCVSATFLCSILQMVCIWQFTASLSSPLGHYSPCIVAGKKKKDQLCDHTLTTNPITVGTQIKEMEFSPSSSCINLNWFLRWFQKKSIKFIFLLHFYYVAVLLRQSCPCFLIMFLLFLRLLYSGALDFLLTSCEVSTCLNTFWIGLLSWGGDMWRGLLHVYSIKW